MPSVAVSSVSTSTVITPLMAFIASVLSLPFAASTVVSLFVPAETPDMMCLTFIARLELVTIPRSMPSFVLTPSVPSSPESGAITSLSTLPTWTSTLGSQSVHIDELAIESSGAVSPSMHSNGPQVT